MPLARTFVVANRTALIGIRTQPISTTSASTPVDELALTRSDCFATSRILLCIYFVYIFLHVHFFLSGRGSFLLLSAPGHAGSPPEHHGVSVGLGRGPWHVLWGFKVTKIGKNHGEAFRARRVIQAHANPRTG